MTFLKLIYAVVVLVIVRPKEDENGSWIPKKEKTWTTQPR